MPNDNDPSRDRPWDRGGRGRDRRDDDDDDRPRRRRDDDDDYDDRPRRRRYEDDDDDYDDRSRRRSGAPGANGLATAGLILGILSICTVGITSVPGLICSILALGKPAGRGAAVAGLGLSCVGALLGVVGLFYGVQKGRESAARMSAANNMKQIGLGMHGYHDANGRLPPADDKLSWRYHILPYIEHAALHRQMDPRQTWDGPANRRFAGESVKTFTTPGDPAVETRYRVFVGPGTLYEPEKKPFHLAEMKDGASNTIMFVEAGETVPWPQPKELAYDRNGRLPQLGAPGRNGFFVGMADGSVRFMRSNTSTEVLRAGIEPQDGRPFAVDE